jgi:hypothetical protein
VAWLGPVRPTRGWLRSSGRAQAVKRQVLSGHNRTQRNQAGRSQQVHCPTAAGTLTRSRKVRHLATLVRRLRSKGNPRNFSVSLSQRIIDALVFGAVGSNLSLIIPRFGHVASMRNRPHARGRIQHKQDRVCQATTAKGHSQSAHAPILRSRSWIGAVCGPSQRTQQRSTTRYNADQRAVLPLVSAALIA